MADIFYFSVEDKEAADDKRMFQIPLKDCVHLFDMRPWQRECAGDEFPSLKTGNPLVDSSGYIHVLMRISSKEIEESGEGSFDEGWYKMNMTVIEVQSIVGKAAQKKDAKQPTPEKPREK